MISGLLFFSSIYNLVVIIMKLERVRVNKLLRFLTIVTVIGFIIGILFISILSDNNKEMVITSINSYFYGLFNGELTYFKSLVSVCLSNLILTLFIWIMGISVVGSVIGISYLMYKSFLLGFSLVSIIYTFKIKGVLLGFIYLIPEVFFLIIYFLLVYYSTSFSYILIRYLFERENFDKRKTLKRYIKILFVILGLVIINSLVLVFIIPNLLKVF